MKNVPVVPRSVPIAVPPVVPPPAIAAAPVAASAKASVDPSAGAEWALLRRVARNPQLARTDPATARAFLFSNSAFSDRRRRRLAEELLLADFDAEQALRVFCCTLPPADAAAARKFLLS